MLTPSKLWQKSTDLASLLRQIDIWKFAKIYYNFHPEYLFIFYPKVVFWLLINQKPVLDTINLVPIYRSHRDTSIGLVYNFSCFDKN
jgi:hypothetical protein